MNNNQNSNLNYNNLHTNVNNNFNTNMNVNTNYNTMNNYQNNNGNFYVNNESNVNRVFTSLDDIKPPKKNIFGKIIVIILLLLVVLFSIYYIFIRDNSDSKINIDTVFDINKPILINDNDKYGYVDNNGKLLTDIKYDSATEFYGGYAAVGIYDNDKKEYSIVNSSFEKVFTKTSDNIPQYITEYDIWLIGGSLYSNKMKEIYSAEKLIYDDNGFFVYSNSKLNVTGIVDYTGEEIFSVPGVDGVTFDISYPYYETDELFVKVVTPDKIYIASTKTDDIIYTHTGNSSELIVEDDGIFGVYDPIDRDIDYMFFYKGQMAVEFYNVKELVVADYDKMILYASNYGSYKYYDVINKCDTEKTDKIEYYEYIYNRNDYTKDYNYTIFECGSKMGIMKGKKVLLSCDYSDIQFLNINLFKYVKKKTSKQVVLLDTGFSVIVYDMKKKEEVRNFVGEDVKTYDDNTFLLISSDVGDSESYIIYNLVTNKYLEIKDEINSLSVNSNNFVVTDDESIKYYNADMKIVYEIKRS